MINDYDKFAKERQEQLKKGEKRPHRFIEKPMMKQLLPDLTDKKVLMLGCGTGEESIMLNQFSNVKLTGIDLSAESIKLAKESYPDCEFIVGDMNSLPFEDNTFDFVYSSLVIHYSENPEKIYKEIYRVLKNEGQLLFSIGHPLRWACEEREIDGVNCRIIAHGIDNENAVEIGNYNTFKKHNHYFKNGEVLSFYVGSPSFHFKLLKKVGFIIEDFSEGICTDEAKDIDYNYWNKYHEIPQFMAFLVKKREIGEKYKSILSNTKVMEAYNEIDRNNKEPFNHGLKHINNVCEIATKLSDILKINSEEKEALLIAIALHDIGQIEGKENHAKNSVIFTINNFKAELENNKYYNEILNAIQFHDSMGSDDDSLFVLLVRFSDKMDFTKNRLEDNYREKYDYIFTEKIDDVKFIFDENHFGLDIVTSDICDFEEQFLSLEFFHKVIYLVKCLANKLNRKPIIMNNGIIMKKIIFDE